MMSFKLPAVFSLIIAKLDLHTGMRMMDEVFIQEHSVFTVLSYFDFLFIFDLIVVVSPKR